MKALFLIFCAATLPATADWKVLRAEGRPVEIAVDFEIESLRIDQNGDCFMVALSKEKDGDLGSLLRSPGEPRERSASSVTGQLCPFGGVILRLNRLVNPQHNSWMHSDSSYQVPTDMTLRWRSLPPMPVFPQVDLQKLPGP
jgi:hypothetical protein